MAITQFRLHQVVQAANQILLVHDGLKTLIVDEARRVKLGEQTYEQAIAAIVLYASTDLTARHELVLQRETIRYNLTHRKNDRDRLRKRGQRLNYDQGPAQYGTHSIDAPVRSAAEVAAAADRDELTTTVIGDMPGIELDETAPRSPRETSGFVLSESDKARIEAEADRALKDMGESTEGTSKG